MVENPPGMDRKGVSPLHDFHTVAAILEPSLYEGKRRKINVTVSGEKEGQTVLEERSDGNTLVMQSVRPKQSFSVLKALLISGMK